MKPLNTVRYGSFRCVSLSVALIALSLTAFIQSKAYALDNNYAVFGDSNGTIYNIPIDGNLLWRQHYGRLSGSTLWANNSQAKTVSYPGSEYSWFTGVDKIFSGNEGVIYIIKPDGQLLWSRHDGRLTGAPEWSTVGTNGKTSLIGKGWNQYSHVFSGGDGVIYAITLNGKMRWFRHTGWQDGTNKWAKGSGKQISKGWQGTLKAFSGGDGVIYSIVTSGRLRWHLHKGRLTGTDEWVNRGIHRPVGFNWQNFRQVFSNGDGIIYATTHNGDLLWHRHNAWLSGKDEWTLGSGKIVAHNFVSRTF